MAQGELKQKTIKSLFWSFTDNFVTQGTSFIVGIILARLLSPKEFGLIGMIMIFIVISRVFVDSGFSQALIRKKDCTQKDYSTIFYFNLLIGCFFYVVLFISAEAISNFYHEAQLTPLIRGLGLVLLINAAGFIQKTILTKEINFKLQTKISIIASIVAGVLGILMAYHGCGVWSLVGKTIAQDLINTLLLWAWNKWRPIWVFSLTSFREMFGFGSKLLVAALVDAAYRNSYYLIIGKCYSAVDLGYYTRADNFQTLPSTTLTSIVQRVSYPVLSSIQDDGKKLKQGYKKLVRNTMFISFFCLIGMSAAAGHLVRALIGEQWLPTVPYLQLLCFVGMLYPLHALNLNVLNVKGRSDLFLRLEVIKKVIAIPTLIMGIFLGIKTMIICMLGTSIVAYFLNSFWTGKLIDYSMKEQLLDIAPSFAGAAIMGGCVYAVGFYSSYSSLLTLGLQVVLGIMIAVYVGKMIKLDAYLELKRILNTRVVNKPVTTDGLSAVIDQ